tara:strand:- start:48 stop:320 length:273 start_codon:yes stop_codon:yes gene_type:complete
MALTKQVIIDKIETEKTNSFFIIQVREKHIILEDGKQISSNYHRYHYHPDADVSTITDATVKAQFKAIMTKEVKANYQTFLDQQLENCIA